MKWKQSKKSGRRFRISDYKLHEIITRIGAPVVIHSPRHPYLGWHYAQCVEIAVVCLRRSREVEFTQTLEVVWSPGRFQQATY